MGSYYYYYAIDDRDNMGYRQHEKKNVKYSAALTAFIFFFYM